MVSIFKKNVKHNRSVRGHKRTRAILYIFLFAQMFSSTVSNNILIGNKTQSVNSDQDRGAIIYLRGGARNEESDWKNSKSKNSKSKNSKSKNSKSKNSKSKNSKSKNSKSKKNEKKIKQYDILAKAYFYLAKKNFALFLKHHQMSDIYEKTAQRYHNDATRMLAKYYHQRLSEDASLYFAKQNFLLFVRNKEAASLQENIAEQYLNKAGHLFLKFFNYSTKIGEVQDEWAELEKKLDKLDAKLGKNKGFKEPIIKPKLPTHLFFNKNLFKKHLKNTSIMSIDKNSSIFIESNISAQNLYYTLEVYKFVKFVYLDNL